LLCYLIDAIGIERDVPFDLLHGTYIFRNRHRFFIAIGPSTMTSRTRHVRLEVVMMPWLGLTSLLVILLIYFWSA